MTRESEIVFAVAVDVGEVQEASKLSARVALKYAAYAQSGMFFDTSTISFESGDTTIK